MNLLDQFNLTLKPSKPNKDGLCTFRLVDSDGRTFAQIDTPCTLDEALAAAYRLLKQELESEEE